MARSSMDSCWQGSTKISETNKRSIKMSLSTRSYGGFNIFIIIVIVGFPVFLTVSAVPHGRPHQRTLRLCSKSLSDALYLVCRERGGYNEPLSYSAEDEARSGPGGPGLVEECCYRPCSYEQLEQYCKPPTDDRTNNSPDGIEESLRIVNLPYSSSQEVVSEKRAVTKNEHHNERATNKSKEMKVTILKEQSTRWNVRQKYPKKNDDEVQIGSLKRKTRMRMIEAEKRRRIKCQIHVDVGKYEKRADNDIDDADNGYFRTGSRHVCRRRKRRKRPTRGKALREEATPVDSSEFKIGTTLPENKEDSTFLLFPSKGNVSSQRVSDAHARNRDHATLKEINFLRRDNRNDNESPGTNRKIALMRHKLTRMRMRKSRASDMGIIIAEKKFEGSVECIFGHLRHTEVPEKV